MVFEGKEMDWVTKRTDIEVGYIGKVQVK